MIGETALKEVYDLAEAINKFGPVIVILAVFILVFLGIMIFFMRSYTSSSKNNQKTFEQMIQQQQQQQQQLFSHILKEKEKEEEKHAADYDERNIVGIFYKLNTHLKAECKKFLDKTECDRIGVYVFHNGTVASHGLPFFKVSCICECIKRGSGICSHITDSTSLPLNLFDDIVEKLYVEEGGCVIVRNTIEGEFHSDSFFLEKDKAATAIFTVIYDSEDNTMAFILGEYRSELTDDEIAEDSKIYKDLCARLKPVLEFSEYQKMHSEK